MRTSGFRSQFRGRASPAVVSIAIVVLFLASTLLASSASGLPARPSSGPTANLANSTPVSTHAVRPSMSTQPLAGVQRERGVFFENNTTFANLPNNRTVCSNASQVYNSSFSSPPYTYYDNILEIYNSCYMGAQSPSTLSLGGNEIGVGYSVLSNESMVGCSNHPDVETSQVAFQLSYDAGQNFGPPTWIGNTSCAYVQSLEPSFAVSSDGDIFGAFVQANYGNATNLTFPFDYGNRSNDSLAFTVSHNGGSRFKSPVTLTIAGTSDIARPVIAAYGASVYIVYENLDNNSAISLTNPYPYASTNPISLEELTSTDGGSTWSGPVTLPGLNASSGYTAMSPSIAVNSAGEIAVAYATNRSCFQPAFFGSCSGFGDDIVVSTSLTNGTTWVGPVQVSPNATGEFQCAGWDNYTYPSLWAYCYASPFQWEPSTSVAWSDVSTSNLYVTWSGEFAVYNASDQSTYIGTSAVFAAASHDGGGTWNDSLVAENVNQGFNAAYYYNPVVGVKGGWVYDSYAESNDSYCYPCAPGTAGSSYWLSTSLTGVTWLNNVTLLLWNPDTYVVDAWVGYTESMAFSLGGPVVTFSQPSHDVYSYGYVYTDITQGTNVWFNETDWENETGFADLTTAYVWSGNTTIVNFTERGLPSGTPWGFTLGSANFTTTGRTIQITNVPLGPGLPFNIPNIADGFWTHYTGFASVNSSPFFTGPLNVSIHFEIEYGIQFLVQPSTIHLFEIEFQLNGTFYLYEYCGIGCSYVEPPFPWYFPIGTVLQIVSSDVYSSSPISYWSGTGNGSSTNFGNGTTLTVDGVINETAWAGAYGSYSVTVAPSGLPNGTPYNFTFDGTAYSGTSPSNVTLSNVVTGAYTVSGITANPGGGYEYFGQVDGGNPVYVPATPVIVLNFSYAYVDIAATPGTVTFQATGLGLGDPWSLLFNGTTYSGTTPWINITTRPGTFGVAASPVEAAFNDTAEYQASGVGPTVSVTIGSTYSVTYSPTYRVVIEAGTGGTVVGSGSHWASPGTVAVYTAHALPNYAFLGWTGIGNGAYSGPNPNASLTVNGPITESANFQALPVDRFNLTVTQTGLPTGIWWTVSLDGVGYSATGATLLIPDLYPCTAGSGGSYAVAVPVAYVNGTSGVRYVPSGYPAQICTNGATQISVSFTEQFLVTPISTGGGSAAVQINGVPQSSPGWVVAGTTVGIEASPETGYAFSAWLGQGPGNYTGATASDELTPTGPVTEVATFTAIVPPPLPTYWVSIHAASGLVAGTPWSVTFNNSHYASTTLWINLTGLPVATYPLVISNIYSSDHLTQFSPSSPPSSIPVTGNSTVNLNFGVAYFVTVQNSTGGTLNGVSSGFVGAGKSLQLNATPNVGYSFVGWTGTGTSAYSGTTASETVVVSGPITEVASFAPIPATAPAATASGLNSTPVLIGLAVVGLVVGLAAGYALFRRRAPPPSSLTSEGGSA